MQKYPTYKPSNIDWIGEIPNHWELTKVKFMANIFGRIGYRGYTVEDIVDEGNGAITISPSNIKNDIFTIENITCISWEKYFESPEIMVFEDDIILVKTGSTIGKTAIIPKSCPEMTINPQLVVLKNIKINNKYFYYQTVCDYFKNSFEVEQTGSTTPTISQEKINSFPLLYLPLQEQQAIVSYLDEKTALIDELILKKERKIELLKEQRAALINQAVTKGLDAEVAFKDTKIEWIGEVPEHWTMTKLKYNGFFISGFSFDSNSFELEGEVRVIKISNVQNEGIIWDDLSFVPSSFLSKYKDFEVKKGDLIFVLTRPIISTGIKVCFYNEDFLALLNQRNSIFRPKELVIEKRLLYYLVRSFYFVEEFKLQLKETNQPNISTEQISNINIFLPPLSEQKSIVVYLDEQTALIDKSIALESQKIDKLKEYRQSLISNVVTGKVKVIE
jgi:type I restriction enzyme, S subunit